MKESVVVNGVTLSRAQVEKAYKELQTPTPVVPKPGTWWWSTNKGFQFMVVENAVTTALDMWRTHLTKIGVLVSPAVFYGVTTEGYYHYELAENFGVIVLPVAKGEVKCE
jgi:hypothetical protein